jgi:hypothetical protein
VAKKKTVGFKDEIVVYHSEEDGCWFAHSLRADQIGAGDRIVDALADLIRGIVSLLDMAREDATIGLKREAPPEVKAIAAKSTALPLEILEVDLARAVFGARTA